MKFRGKTILLSVLVVVLLSYFAQDSLENLQREKVILEEVDGILTLLEEERGEILIKPQRTLEYVVRLTADTYLITKNYHEYLQRVNRIEGLFRRKAIGEEWKKELEGLDRRFETLMAFLRDGRQRIPFLSPRPRSRFRIGFQVWIHPTPRPAEPSNDQEARFFHLNLILDTS